jgi:glutathione peroxidase
MTNAFTLSLATLLLLGSVTTACATAPSAIDASASPANTSLFDDLTALDGTPLPASELSGKVVLFVNVASKCGFTRQYDGLQALYESRKDDGLVIVGVPCNQFGGQEPGNAQEIASFCRMNYGVTFPLLEKQEVNGDGRSDLYRRLVSSSAGGDRNISWNFEKFLVGRDGQVMDRFASHSGPSSAGLTAAVDKALAAK